MLLLATNECQIFNGCFDFWQLQFNMLQYLAGVLLSSIILVDGYVSYIFYLCYTRERKKQLLTNLYY